MNVGFVGLGLMGRSMAVSLLKAGHRLTVYNRTRRRSEELFSAGALIADSAAAACQGSVVITCLADDQAVEATVFGEQGIAAALAPAGIHVSMSTISLDLTRQLASIHRQAGQKFVAAPVFGRPDTAVAGRLLVVASGDDDAIALCRPLFDALGQKTIVLGPDPLAAPLAKLVGNFLLVSAVEALAEAMALLRKSGADATQCLHALTDTLFAAPVYQHYASLMLQQRYEPGFRMALAMKDIGLALAAAKSLGVPLPAAELVDKRLEVGAGQGYENKDLAALALVSAQGAGLPITMN
jgi:3-hydroxyisobutyrate dehydrogenase-like beta-hydroxyacid dehydrogenase